MRTFILSLLIGLFSFGLSAQTNIGFYYNHTIPLGMFAENADTQVGGFMWTTMFKPLKNKKFAIGAEVGVSMYANEDFEYTVSDGDFQGSYVEVNQDDCFVQYGLAARYYMIDLADNKLINPYVEARGGGMTFFSTLTEGEACEIDYHSETETHGTTFYAGAGAGVVFQMNSCVNIDLNFNYNRSGNAAYRHVPEPEDVSYRLELTDHMYESRTDHIGVKLGVLVGF